MENYQTNEEKILSTIKSLARKKDSTVKEIIEKGTDMTEAGFYMAIKKGTLRLNTLISLANYLNVPLSTITGERNEISETKINDSNLFEFLRKENEFLRGFIKEKFAVNFNPVSGYATVFLGLFLCLY